MNKVDTDRCEITQPICLASNPSPPLSTAVKQNNGSKARMHIPNKEIAAKVTMIRVMCCVKSDFSEGCLTGSPLSVVSTFGGKVSFNRKYAVNPLINGKRDARAMGKRYG